MKFLTIGIYHLRQLVKLAVNYRGERSAVMRQEVFDLLRPFAPAVAVENGDIWYYLSTNDYGLSRIVFRDGSYEEDIMSYAIELAEACCGRKPLLKGRTFVDVGANLGTSTIPVLKRFDAADAVCFEPDHDNYKFLRCNLIANDVYERVRTVEVALSDRTGDGVLEWAEGNWGDHRIRMRTDLPDGRYRESLRDPRTVRLARFDDVVRDLPIDLGRVGMVWMDVQGHEGHVLAGASSILESDIPVVIEYWPYALERSDGLGLLHELVARHYRRIIDIRASMAAGRTVEWSGDELDQLAARYGSETYTDLLLVS